MADPITTHQEELRGIFAAFCSFGDKANTTQMDGAKFTKLAKETGLIAGNLTKTDVELIFTKVKPKTERRLSFENFVEGVKAMAEKRKGKVDSAQSLEEVVNLILKAGGASSSGTVADAGGIYSKLTDSSLYTGAHKERFNADGTGKGIEGRDHVSKDNNLVSKFPERTTSVGSGLEKKPTAGSPSSSSASAKTTKSGSSSTLLSKHGVKKHDDDSSSDDDKKSSSDDGSSKKKVSSSSHKTITASSSSASSSAAAAAHPVAPSAAKPVKSLSSATLVPKVSKSTSSTHGTKKHDDDDSSDDDNKKSSSDGSAKKHSSTVLHKSIPTASSSSSPAHPVAAPAAKTTTTKSLSSSTLVPKVAKSTSPSHGTKKHDDGDSSDDDHKKSSSDGSVKKHSSTSLHKSTPASSSASSSSSPAHPAAAPVAKTVKSASSSTLVPKVSKSASPADKHASKKHDDDSSSDDDDKGSSSDDGPMDQLLRVFQTYCSFGDRANKTQMDSAKFTKLAKETSLIGGPLTATDIDLIFTKSKPSPAERRLDFDHFKSALSLAAVKKYADLTPEEAFEKAKTVVCSKGATPASSGTKSDASGIYGKLTDSSKYTGSHKERFDENGVGKGLAGRDSIAKGQGSAAAGSVSSMPMRTNTGH